MSSRRILPRLEYSGRASEEIPEEALPEHFLPRPVSPNAVYLEQLKAKCLETYLPSSGTSLIDLRRSWQWSIRGKADLGRPLASAFAALNLARLGLVYSDQDLISQGRSQYGLALMSVQEALNTPELAFRDTTLAAMRTLSIYEHLSPTFAPTPPGRVHEDGMAQWCAAGGPQRVISSEFAMEVFKDVRWSIMIHSIDRRKSSVLGSDQWKIAPWHHFEKDSLQQLFDIGLDLAALLERIDLNNVQSGAEFDKTAQTQLWSSCFEILRQLEQWYGLHWARRQPQQDLPNLELLDIETAEATVSQQPLVFESFWEANNLVYYWAFRLVLDESVLSLSKNQSRISPASTPGRSTSISSPASRATSSSRHSILAVEGLSTSQMQQMAGTNLKFAIDINRAAPTFLAEDTGWLGPQRLFFPLRRAMQHFASIQSPILSELARKAFFSTIFRLHSQCGDKT